MLSSYRVVRSFQQACHDTHPHPPTSPHRSATGFPSHPRHRHLTQYPPTTTYHHLPPPTQPQVCDRLPVVNVRVGAPTLTTPKPAPSKGGASDPSDPWGGAGGDGYGDEEGGQQEPQWVVEVELHRLRRGGAGGKGRPRVYAPRFPKVRASPFVGVGTK